jgi:hypothetical protein
MDEQPCDVEPQPERLLTALSPDERRDMRARLKRIGDDLPPSVRTLVNIHRHNRSIT